MTNKNLNKYANRLVNAFLNNKIITLTAEIIEVILEDQKNLDDKNTEL